MKIEKINENQIRCTLTREDLANREINLSELAYGSEKARTLFRDMMQQAAHDFGFEANNIPLMIEAIPLSSDSIILIITKVEDPEELDTRFSRFSPDESSASENAVPAVSLTGADEILDLIRKINQARKAAAEKEKAQEEDQKGPLPGGDHVPGGRLFRGRHRRGFPPHPVLSFPGPGHGDQRLPGHRRPVQRPQRSV